MAEPFTDSRTYLTIALTWLAANDRYRSDRGGRPSVSRNHIDTFCRGSNNHWIQSICSGSEESDDDDEKDDGIRFLLFFYELLLQLLQRVDIYGVHLLARLQHGSLKRTTLRRERTGLMKVRRSAVGFMGILIARENMPHVAFVKRVNRSDVLALCRRMWVRVWLTVMGWRWKGCSWICCRGWHLLEMGWAWKA